MSEILIKGDISCEEVAEALKKAFPARNFRLNGAGAAAAGAIDISACNDHATGVLLKKIADKENDVKSAEEAAKKALVTMQTLNKQQQDLFDEFVLLRQRYDEQKTNTVNILWNYCAKYHPDLRQIPTMQDVETYVENDERVGELHVGEALGEGQFATVRNCSYENNDRAYALKIIRKDRITSFTSLMRVSNEIDNLRLLKSPFIVTVEQVIHTQDMLYIVTEKGGRDLFDFFDEHPDGVPETWAREIITCVLKGVLYCHDQGVCHRDLKPENILVSFDTKTERCVDLKLCDFGLSTKYKPKVLLTDFCGSPGFFCPEMIIHGSYFGDKADVWSVGCILLELILGHERFCELWMVAYDYDVLQDKGLFTKTIEETATALPDHLDFSTDLNDFVVRFLDLRSSRRPHIKSLAVHPWLEGRLLDDIASGPRSSFKLSLDTSNRPWSPPTLSPTPSFNGNSFPISQETINTVFDNVSDRERKVFEDYNSSHMGEDGEHQLHLPPITPATPNIGAAKKILRKGNELANTVTNNNNAFFGHAIPDYSALHTPKQPHHPSRSRLPSLIEAVTEDVKEEVKHALMHHEQDDPRANSAPSKEAMEKPGLYASNSEGVLRAGGK